MNKDDFIIYCLLYAVDAANVKKQNLVQMALKTDAVDFVKVYNRYAFHDDSTKLSEMENCRCAYINSDEDLELFLDDFKATFLSEENSLYEESILENLRTILM